MTAAIRVIFGRAPHDELADVAFAATERTSADMEAPLTRLFGSVVGERLRALRHSHGGAAAVFDEPTTATFAEYPGCREDLEGVAALHDRRPQIVLLAREGTALPAGRHETAPPAGRHETAPSAATASAESTTEPVRRAAHALTANPHGRLPIRHLWLIPGLALAYFASGEAARTGAGIA